MMNALNFSAAARFQEVGVLFLRVVTGVVFFMHGYGKVQGEASVADFAGFLGSLSVPAPEFFAYLVIAIEIIGGIALIVGLWTRSAAALTGTVALFSIILVHAENGFALQAGGYEYALLLLASAVALMTIGSGRYALDALMGDKSSDGRSEEPTGQGEM